MESDKQICLVFQLQPQWTTPLSHIEPMQKITATLLKHDLLLLNWFHSQGLSSGVVEGFNNKAKLTMKKAYVLKEIETIKTE